MKLIKLFFLPFVLLGAPQAISANGADLNCVEILDLENSKVEKSLIGVWSYEIENSPFNFEQGKFFITERDGETTVALQLDNGVITAYDVVVKDNKIWFNINNEGLKKVSILLVASGDLLKGEIYSEDTSYKITAKRIIF